MYMVHYHMRYGSYGNAIHIITFITISSIINIVIMITGPRVCAP